MNVQINSLQPASKHGISPGVTVLPGEDEAAYHDFLGRLYAAVKPVDIIDKMLIDDVASLEWEILRWRRLEWSLMQLGSVKALKKFLSKHLDYDHDWKFFEEEMTEVLRDNLPDHSKESAGALAHKLARSGELDVVDKVILRTINLDRDNIWKRARIRRVEELVRDYVQRKRSAIKLIQKLLARAGLSINAVMAEALADELDNIERINRLATIAETRRNAALREIDRRRAVVAQGLRRHLQKAEGEVIDVGEVNEKTAAEAKDAA